MTTQEELKKIKKVYGEKFMHLCRELFSTILEEGNLYETLYSLFSENCKTLYDDIVNNNLEDELKDYIYSKIDGEEQIEQEKQDIQIDEKINLIDEKTPYELLEEAGYELIECKTEEEIQEFKKYYENSEELCTFTGRRLDKYIVFWAVKKDVENIKREDFKKPKREDEYGTSVMSIQFNRKGICTVSIKNRYNHHVNNPDATYGNDLDNIIPGLTESFARLLKERGLILNKSNIEKLNIPGYKVVNGKYYKYNMEIKGTYYCPGNIIIENDKPKKLGETESQILIDYFLLNMKTKTIDVYDHSIKDSFIDGLQGIERIEVTSNKKKGTRIITINTNQLTNILVEIDRNNQIIGYTNNELTEIGNKFLHYNKKLTRLETLKLVRVGNRCLYNNKGVIEFKQPELIEAGNYLLYNNEGLVEFETPKLVRVGYGCLYNNKGVIRFKQPELIEAGDYLLHNNEGLVEFETPKLVKMGSECLYHVKRMKKFNAPELTEVGDGLLYNDEGINSIELEEEEMQTDITANDIAKLDKDNEMTTSEISIGKEIISNLIGVSDKLNDKT